MNVSLTPELEQLVQSKVSTGRYQSSSEVIREALRLLEEHDREKETRLQALRAEIEKGFVGEAKPLDMAKIKREARAEWEAEKLAKS